MTQRYRSSFGLSDGLILALALVGYVVFAVLLPGQHPYSAVDFTGRGQAVKSAEAFMAVAGFQAPAEATAQAHLRGNGPLLDSLQETMGRPEAIRFVETEEGQRFGAFHWRVGWRKSKGGEEDIAVARLTPDGRILAFEIAQPAEFEQVAVSLGEAGGVLGTVGSPPDTLQSGAVAPGATPPGTSMRMRLSPEARVQEVIGQTAYAGLGLQLDSLQDGNMTRAYLGGATLAGRPLRVEVHLDRVGQLLRLSAHVTQPAAPGQASPRDLYGIMVIGLYVILLIVTFVAFFRRLAQRLVDTRAALRDALWLGLAGMGWMVSVIMPAILQSVPSPWLAFGIILLNMLLGGLATAFVGLAVSGAGDSLTRPVWPQRLASLSLLRVGAWYDARVGAALVRGLAGSGIILGLVTVVLVALPHVALHLGGDSVTLADEAAVSPALFMSSFYALVGVFQLYAIVLVVGAGLRQRLGVFTYGLMAVLLAAVQIVILAAAPGWQFALHLIPAVVVLWMFHRYDALSAFLALAVYGLLWDMAYVWMGEDVPAQTGGIILLGVLILLFVIGLWVMLRGRHVREDQALVPSYIREQQHEARMERELEIAHNVQLTFLPRQMPEVCGLDLAALCLPAMEVGGDYYDFVELGDDRLALVIGDVSGKGIQAAFYMTLVKGFVRSLARTGAGPADVLRRINKLFCESAPRGTFISMIYGVVDVRARTFTFARAGHNPVILHRAPSQQADMLQPPGLAIGLDPGPRFDPSLYEETLPLGVGDTLVLYTDGFSEAMNTDHALYGDQRLADRASHARSPSARHLLDALTHGVNAFMDGEPQHDDMTMIVLRCTFDAPVAHP